MNYQEQIEYEKKYGGEKDETPNTDAQCTNCGNMDCVDNMIVAEDMFFCSIDCKRDFTGEDVL